MTKLSPNYRDDNLEDLPDNVRAYLDEHFFQKLSNLKKPHPKLLVVFSGGNAVGKSTISEQIRRKFDAVVLENDAIKVNILALKPDIGHDELNSLTWKYTMSLYKRLSSVTPNGLIVRDGVIHWYFERILPIFEKQGFELFIISFDISKEKQIELIKARGDKATVNVEKLVSIMADHEIHTKRFNEIYTPDVVVTDDTLFDSDRILLKLGERLKRLSN